MPKFKQGEDGKPVFQDGKFVLILDDGSETPFDALGAYSTFGTIRKERDDARDEAKAAKAALAAFGASDEDRKKLIEKAKLADSIDAKKLVDAGKVEELVAERLKDATKGWQEKETALTSQIAEARSSVRKHLISSRFATSKALESTILTPDLAEAKFGHLFDLDGDKVVAFRDGNKKEKVYSRSDPSNVADFDEALSIFLTSDSNYPKWKAGSGANGGGAPGASKAGSGADLSALSPEDRLTAGFAGARPN